MRCARGARDASRLVIARPRDLVYTAITVTAPAEQRRRASRAGGPTYAASPNSTAGSGIARWAFMRRLVDDRLSQLERTGRRVPYGLGLMGLITACAERCARNTNACPDSTSPPVRHITRPGRVMERLNIPKHEETPSTLRFRSSEGVSLSVAAPGFEPGKAEPADLQSAPFGRSGTPPGLLPVEPLFGGAPWQRRKQYPMPRGASPPD
jgi:hypothetical protein